MTTPSNPHIIGLTGSFGSGCTYIAHEILVAQKGYTRISLSDILKKEYAEQTGDDLTRCPRRKLQDFGDKMRRENGHDYFALKAVKEMEEKSKDTPATKWVVDSIRNTAEIRVLSNFSTRFFLFGVYADQENRWNRVRHKYDNDKKSFENDDKNDRGDRNKPEGQHVGNCFYQADVVIANDRPIVAAGNAEFQSLANRVGRFASLAEHPLTGEVAIRPEESLMAVAYSVAKRSSCLQRKVGAVIVDGEQNVISSGFNEVPGSENTCQQEFTTCYRSRFRESFFKKLSERNLTTVGKESEFEEAFREDFRILDLCRALHAEDNAITNLARNGRSVPLSECTLYTTTYPCRMCASKIVRIGIPRIVYLEPYPDPAAIAILRGANITTEFFEGITFRAYFRIYGEER